MAPQLMCVLCSSKQLLLLATTSRGHTHRPIHQHHTKHPVPLYPWPHYNRGESVLLTSWVLYNPKLECNNYMYMHIESELLNMSESFVLKYLCCGALHRPCHVHITGCFGLYWSVLVCIGLYWSVLVCIGLYWSVLVCISLYWSVLVCIGLYWSVPVCIGLYWSVLVCLVCTGLYWSVLVCTGHVSLKVLSLKVLCVCCVFIFCSLSLSLLPLFL